MDTVTPAQVLDDVLARVGPRLAAGGYRKSARTFAAIADGVARAVIFQTSQLKKPDEATFTLSLLVTAIPFHEAYTGKAFPKNAASGEPVVQASIGRLMPDGEEIWWSLKPGVSSALIAREIDTLLTEVVLPFLARFQSGDALLAELSENGDALPGFVAMRERCRAVLLAARGRKTEAGAALSALLEANAAEGLEGFRDSVHQLAKRIGVKL